MGLPIKQLVIATNENDILARTLSTGRYEMAGVRATTSPSMDIQISSNFERLVFEATGRDAATVVRLMDGLKQSGAFTLPQEALDAIRRDFAAAGTDEQACAAQIAALLADNGYLMDPHTSIGVDVASRLRGEEAMVTLSTAHPAKFPDAVEAACGVRPHLPEWLGDLMAREESYEIVPNDLGQLEAYILARVRT